MIHVLLRIAVWMAVFGIGYLVFGPQLFDSSQGANPFETDARLFLPPAKSPRQLEYEQAMKSRKLGPEELADYQSLVLERESKFWQREGVSVEKALSGVKTQRKEYLAKILAQRGMSREESVIFFMVIERDHPALLADLE